MEVRKKKGPIYVKLRDGKWYVLERDLIELDAQGKDKEKIKKVTYSPP